VAKAASGFRWDVVEALFGRCKQGCCGIAVALEVAAGDGQVYYVELLMQKSTKNGADCALDLALEKNHWDVIKLLFTRCRSYTVGTALEKAAFQRRWDLVELMYERCGGFAVGYTLEAAAECGQWNLVKLSYGRSMEYYVGKALLLAVSCSRWDVIGLLRTRCRSSCDIGQALGKAASDGKLNIVELLCDKTEAFYVGQAVQCAAASVQREVVKLLCEKCENVDVVGTVKTAASNSQWSVVQGFLQKFETQWSTSAMSYDAGTLLDTAASEGQPAIVQILYDKCQLAHVGAALEKATPAVEDFFIETCGVAYVRNAIKVVRALSISSLEDDLDELLTTGDQDKILLVCKVFPEFIVPILGKAIRRGLWRIACFMHRVCKPAELAGVIEKAAARGELTLTDILLSQDMKCMLQVAIAEGGLDGEKLLPMTAHRVSLCE
jgi:hypothetical protein